MIDHDTLMAEMLRRLDAKEIKGKDLAGYLGIEPARVTEMRKGRRRIQQHEMPLLARLFGMDEAPERPLPFETIEVLDVPVIGLGPAGSWREAIEVPSYTMKMAKPPAGKKISFAVEISGDSMDKLLPEGGWAAVDATQKTLYDNRVYLVMNEFHEATVKRYHSNPSRLEPVSHNPAHETIMLGEGPITIIGRIISYGHDNGL